ncbi:hypothetical protein Taro_051247 [Colocasia esculenta]|uniref:Wall-associated receptor kinase galacturonan-binding domain-containing protein n=1 Tax=Colocasia esculenta TaxID=4460 RepID=A0A843XFJ8_COLES|nr:hypothetical protein [Colocasia esculenta]
MAIGRFPSSLLPIPLLSLFFLLLLPLSSLSSCSSSCGSLPVRYPFGTGYGCGSPLFHPSVTCTGEGDEESRLVLTTHTGIYPITSISYSTSTLTISPPAMSNCSTMFPSTPNFGLDWSGPFQLGPSLFVLLDCPAPTSSLTYKGKSPICDATETHLCASLYSCPGVLSLDIPIFAPADTCCVYSPASLGPKGELDLQGLRCAAYTSVMSYGDVATDPLRWRYGVVLKFGQTGFQQYGKAEVCAACERSGGVCGYAPPKNYFVCVCGSGVNTSVDCASQENAATEYYLTSSAKTQLPSQGNLFGCSIFVLALFVVAIKAM